MNVSAKIEWEFHSRNKFEKSPITTLQPEMGLALAFRNIFLLSNSIIYLYIMSLPYTHSNGKSFNQLKLRPTEMKTDRSASKVDRRLTNQSNSIFISTYGIHDVRYLLFAFYRIDNQNGQFNINMHYKHLPFLITINLTVNILSWLATAHFCFTLRQFCA